LYGAEAGLEGCETRDVCPFFARPLVDELIQRFLVLDRDGKEGRAMRAEIYRQLRALGFEEKEARVMSVEFDGLLRSFGVVSAKVLRTIVKDLAVGLLHSWVLALII
jgi:hypothetical protein